MNKNVFGKKLGEIIDRRRINWLLLCEYNNFPPVQKGVKKKIQKRQQYLEFCTSTLSRIMPSSPELKTQKNSNLNSTLNLKQTEMDESRFKHDDYNTWSRNQLISRLKELERLSSQQEREREQEQKEISGNEKLMNLKRGTRESILHLDKRGNSRDKEKRTAVPRLFDPTKYSTRFVAFKLAYFGKRYSGFEFHANNPTPLPTVEEELWKAFTKAKLIFPHPSQAVGSWEGCEYSKCGRTDRGVSAFGQVIGLRVRSNRPLGRKRGDRDRNVPPMKNEEEIDSYKEKCGYSEKQSPKKIVTESFNTLPRENMVELAAEFLSPREQNKAAEFTKKEDNDIEHDISFDPVADELPYIAILNRLLPPDIRFLAWCPAPPLDFSARFSCRERQYRYFFTQPCFIPIPNSIDPFFKPESATKDGFLDIEKMRAAAKLYEGLHDFRNLCKVDASKQLDNFVRRIYHADIEEVSETSSTLEFLNSASFQLSKYDSNSKCPKVYAFVLHGSAFLWHQVRHMMAILFLVGQGLEDASIITELLNVEKNPRRPTYQMAAETPLVLWDCIFAHEDDTERSEKLQWIYIGDTPGTADMKYGVPTGGLMDDLWRTWRERKIDEILSSSLLGLVAGQGESLANLNGRPNGKGRSQKVFDGSDTPKLQGKYTPVMKKPVMDTVDMINQRYAIRKGFESSTDLKEQGFRRLNNPGPDHNVESDIQV
ncbi:putative pseudouridylate synthase 3 [Erysiphe neolycopersici]|uniref:Putative pseudouridylate synthase 3 n=1 Tax=Erysiphe neolycopersici TaxID=212602 RepID=A0A420I2Y5_9PEZI|nr:putative pseudouridylate synthase 3 [Erysiphe neolycopersici]